MARKKAKTIDDAENILVKEVRNLKQRAQKLRTKTKVRGRFPDITLSSDVGAAGQRLQADFDAFLQQAESRYLDIIKQDLSASVTAKLLQYGLVDTGALRDSLDVILEKNGLVISYNVPYANLMHYGGYIQPYGNPNAQPVYLPGRPWVEDALNGYDYESAYLRALAEA